MTAVAMVCAVLLGVTGLLCLIRIVRGPTMLDRTVATDVFVAVSLAAVGVEAAVGGHTSTVPVLLALALVGFLGSVSIARFAARDTGASQETSPGDDVAATDEDMEAEVEAEDAGDADAGSGSGSGSATGEVASGSDAGPGTGSGSGPGEATPPAGSGSRGADA